jgi:pyruvate/2-oxoglutarate dehydrogenase complex dihydrolipoamide dehydrogenase (E3) component
MTYDLLVIGTGPGGYVCAVCNSRLEMSKIQKHPQTISFRHPSGP